MQTHTDTQATPDIFAFWFNWLTYTTIFTMLFGLFMVVAPGLTTQGFGLLIFQNAQQFNAFDPLAVRYIELAQAVMGSLMVGWGALMFMLVRKLPSSGAADVLGIRQMLILSLLLWYIPDSTFSIYSGFWQNAVLNTSFALMYALGLWGLRDSTKA
jgi:hypothetical protein